MGTNVDNAAAKSPIKFLPNIIGETDYGAIDNMVQNLQGKLPLFHGKGEQLIPIYSNTTRGRTTRTHRSYYEAAIIRYIIRNPIHHAVSPRGNTKCTNRKNYSGTIIYLGRPHGNPKFFRKP